MFVMYKRTRTTAARTIPLHSLNGTRMSSLHRMAVITAYQTTMSSGEIIATLDGVDQPMVLLGSLEHDGLHDGLHAFAHCVRCVYRARSCHHVTNCITKLITTISISALIDDIPFGPVSAFLHDNFGSILTQIWKHLMAALYIGRRITSTPHRHAVVMEGPCYGGGRYI